jgi:hypothetical protein
MVCSVCKRRTPDIFSSIQSTLIRCKMTFGMFQEFTSPRQGIGITNSSKRFHLTTPDPYSGNIAVLGKNSVS